MLHFKVPVPGFKIVRKEDQEKLRKKHVGPGEKWSNGACNRVLIKFKEAAMI